MNGDFTAVVRGSKALNSKLFSLPRLLILLAIENLGPDGAQYRELKAGLELDDGVLYSNLNALKKMQYITEIKVKIEGKELTSFAITEEGKNALNSIRKWLKISLEGGNAI